MSPTPTGISKPFRNYFSWPRTGWGCTGSEMHNERLQLSGSGATFLHRSFADTAGGEPAHDSRIPRHLSFVAPVRLKTPSTRALPTTDRGSRCALRGEVL